MTKALIIAGLACTVLAYLLPRERNELVLTDGDRGARAVPQEPPRRLRPQHAREAEVQHLIVVD